jgi:phage shock protein A
LQKTLDSERLAFKREQQAFENKIVEMTTSAANLHTDTASREVEVNTLEQRAKVRYDSRTWFPFTNFFQDAERRYEDAIKAHAQAIAVSDGLKRQLDEAQTSLREWRGKADTAESKFNLSESSWNTQKSLLDKELADVNRR